jgi:hypothetical protein
MSRSFAHRVPQLLVLSLLLAALLQAPLGALAHVLKRDHGSHSNDPHLTLERTAPNEHILTFSALGEAHRFVLVKDDDLFAAQATLVTHNSSAPLTTQATYWAKPSPESPVWATATLHQDPSGQWKVDGLFAVRGKNDSASTLVHIMPEGSTHAYQAHAQSGVAFTDEVAEVPNRAPNRYLRAGERAPEQRTRSRRALQADVAASGGGPIVFYPSCYPQDTVQHTLRISVAVDVAFQNQVLAANNNDPAAVTREVEAAVAVARVVYLAQLNVALQVKQVYLGTAQADVPLSRDTPACPLDISLSLQEFHDWRLLAYAEGKVQQTGAFMFLTGCHPPPGVVGLANRDALCYDEFSLAVVGRFVGATGAMFTWLTFAHELGHVFGSTHSFENGTGTTGGIMDYGRCSAAARAPD